ncbi:amino acid-binding protein [Clostridia bacterium]|nr:amino acid-binding protein [Clostridia bacterium]
MLNQISVFVENRPGRLAEIIDIISTAGVNIRALSIADTADFGILRLVVDKPGECRAALKNAGVTAKITPVIAARMDDKAGSLNKILSVLSVKGLDLEYVYAFLGLTDGAATLVISAAKIEDAAAALTAAGVELIENA